MWSNVIYFLIDPRNNVYAFLLVFTDGVAKVMSVVDTSPPAWYTYYPRPVAGAAHPRDPSSMREKHSSPRKMVAAMPAVVPCVSPKQGSVYPTNHHRHHHHHHYNNNNNNNINVTDNNNRDDGHRHHRQQHHHQDRDDSADDNMMPFDLSRNGGSTPSSSPRSPHRSQRMSPAAFKPYDSTGAGINNDQPLDLRVDHKKSRRGDELEDENQNLIIRTPSPEDIEVDSPGPPSLQSYPLPTHHNHNRNIAVHSPCSSDKDVNVTDDQDQQLPHHHQQHHQHHRRAAAGITVDDERHHHHRMVNYPVLFPPQQLHPMMLEAMYRAGAGAGGGAGGGGDKTRLPTSLAGYQPAAGGGGGFHRPSQHYPFINSPLLNGHHHVPPPTYDVVRPPPPPPVARSPQQKSSAFQETAGKPKDR